jgi:hypothetical protein
MVSFHHVTIHAVNTKITASYDVGINVSEDPAHAMSRVDKVLHLD